jgi:glutathione peroxidase
VRASSVATRRGAQPGTLYHYLGNAAGEFPSWNFHKYLVGRDGRAIAHFGSMADPTGRTMTAAIEKALASR